MGALLAIGAGVRLLGHVGYVWQMSRLYTAGPARYARSAMTFGAFQSAGGLIADVLFIVGLALILRRLPSRAR